MDSWNREHTEPIFGWDSPEIRQIFNPSIQNYTPPDPRDNPSPPDSSGSEGSSLTIGARVGIGIGVALVVGGIAMTAVIFWRRRRKLPQSRSQNQHSERNHQPIPSELRDAKTPRHELPGEMRRGRVHELSI